MKVSTFVTSCECLANSYGIARCRPILGFMLCGHQQALQQQRDRAVTARAKVLCPVCGGVIRAEKFVKHAKRCGGRLYTKAMVGVGSTVDAVALSKAMQEVKEQEQKQAVEILRATDGGREAVASGLSISPEEAKQVIRWASLACPLATDDTPLTASFEPVTVKLFKLCGVKVLYEDEELLIVDKPANLRVAPIHRRFCCPPADPNLEWLLRWNGNSLLGRALAHCDSVPHILHRLDMDTTGKRTTSCQAPISNHT